MDCFLNWVEVRPKAETEFQQVDFSMVRKRRRKKKRGKKEVKAERLLVPDRDIPVLSPHCTTQWVNDP